MTKEEALALEKRCDEIMSEWFDSPCTVSMSLSGGLKVSFSEHYIILSRDMCSVSYIRFSGFYSDLEEYSDWILRCVEENRGLFDRLLWSYEHRAEFYPEF